MFSREPVPLLFRIFFDSSIIATVVIALIVAWAYRRAVLRYMRASGNDDPRPQNPADGKPRRQWSNSRLVIGYSSVGALTVALVTAEFISGDAISISLESIATVALRLVEALSGQAQSAGMFIELISQSLLVGFGVSLGLMLELPGLAVLVVLIAAFHCHKIWTKRRSAVIHRSSLLDASSATKGLESCAHAANLSSATLRIITIEPGHPLVSSHLSLDFAAQESALRLRLTLIYGMAIGALIVLALWIEFATGTRMFTGFLTFQMGIWFTGGGFFQMLAYTTLYTAVIVPVVGVLLAWPLRQTLSVLVTYLVGWVTITQLVALAYHLPSGAFVIGTTHTAGLIMWQQLMFLLFLLRDPLLLFLFAGGRRLRAIVPITLAGVLTLVALFLIVLRLAVWAYEAGFVAPGLLRGLGHTGIIFVIAVAPAAFVSWKGVLAIERQYERKSFSEMQLIVDCWVLVGVWYAYPRLGVTHGAPESLILVALFAFVGYRGLLTVALRYAIGKRAITQNRRLLLLRVFGFQKRTERLFDVVAQRWRFTGNVQMIVGTDVATRSVSPSDILRFIAGSLDRFFIGSAATLEFQLTKLDNTRDADGRFRINKLFCHDNYWRQALVALIPCSDVVLMDLRGFSAERQGCVYELQQIIARLHLDNIILIVDSSTDLPLLKQMIQGIFAGDVATKRSTDAETLTLFHINKHSGRAIDTLFELLWGAKPVASITS